MLGDELHKSKQSEISKSSILPEEMDARKLKDLIDKKDRLIRKQQQKIKKLEDQLKRATSEKNVKLGSMENIGGDNIHMQLLRSEVSKTSRLQKIIEEITDRVNIILEDLSNDNTLTENSEEIKQMILMLEASKNQSFSSESESLEFESHLNISDEWAKAMDILQGALNAYKNKFKALSMQNKLLATDKQNLKKTISSLQTKISDNQELRLMSLELKQQKKQKEKMKKLLEKTQFQKNELINKINSIGLKEDVKAKTKEQLLQYSKELNYRIKDLQNEKASIIKQSAKEKQDDLRKYQDFLKKLKTIKEKSVLGKSYG